MPELHVSVQRALGSRRQRRHVAQAAATLGGGLLLALAAARPQRFAIARSDDDDSGRGRGRGRGRGGDNSGPGNAEDRGEAPVAPAAVPAGSLEVRIVSDDAGGFVPGELTVDLGQTVAFVNAHSDEHTATGSGFDTGIIPEGGIATVVLDAPGVFRYACLIHPEMTGRIDVRDESGVVPQAAPEQAPEGAQTVRIVNLAYEPNNLAVPVGATVTWSNEDAVPHTVTADDGAFDSGIFDPGASFTQTFAQPGSFAYHCQLHPNMMGTIRVGDAPGAAPAQAASPPAESAPAAVATPVSERASVAIVDFAFEPQELEVAMGTTVVWTNAGAAPHTVTGDWAASEILQPGETFSHTFETEGRLAYVCAIHPEMTGAVVVGPAGAAPVEVSAADTADPSGVWRVDLASDNPATLGAYQAVLAIRPDGTLAADFAALTTTSSPIALTSGHGEWEVQDPQLVLMLTALVQDEARHFAGLATFTARSDLAGDGQTLAGTFTFVISDENGELTGEGTGVIAGELVPFPT